MGLDELGQGLGSGGGGQDYLLLPGGIRLTFGSAGSFCRMSGCGCRIPLPWILQEVLVMPSLWELIDFVESVSVVVPWVRDGDSMRLEVADLDVRLHGLTPSDFDARLYGVDAPEMDQEMGGSAKGLLMELTGPKGSVFRFDLMDVDERGNPDRGFDGYRVIGVLTRVDGDREESVNLQLARAGLAWPYPRYGVLAGCAEAWAEAERNGAGVWSLPAERRVEPEVHRRRRERL